LVVKTDAGTPDDRGGPAAGALIGLVIFGLCGSCIVSLASWALSGGYSFDSVPFNGVRYLAVLFIVAIIAAALYGLYASS
jgi:hypothetical protein